LKRASEPGGEGEQNEQQGDEADLTVVKKAEEAAEIGDGGICLS